MVSLGKFHFTIVHAVNWQCGIWCLKDVPDLATGGGEHFLKTLIVTARACSPAHSACADAPATPSLALGEESSDSVGATIQICDFPLS